MLLLHRLLARRPGLRVFLTDPAGVAALVVTAALVVLAVIGPSVWGAEAARLDPSAATQGVSWAHPFGTDDLGRDVFARTLAATRLSLLLAVLATTVAAGLGILAGILVASIRRPALRAAAARMIDALLAFPSIVVALFFAAIFNLGGTGAALAVGLAGGPSFARFAYTLSLSVRGQDFVAAAELLNLPRRRVMARHILPNMAEPLVTTLSLAVGNAIVSVSALSFLGLGVQPLAFDWGSLTTVGLQNLYGNPAAALGPGAAIVLAGTAFGSLGDAVAKAIDPRSRPRRSGEETAEAVPLVEEPVLAPASVAAPLAAEDPDTVLRVENLRVTIPSAEGGLYPVDGVSFSARRGEVLGIVGESGSGKSMTVLSIAGLCPYPAQVEATRLEVCGRAVETAGGDGAPGGRDLAVVFQDPMSALNPALKVGTQMAEGPRAHMGLSREQAATLATESLRSVGLAAPELRMRQYPHELSGGMRQRVAIASGLAMEPALLLADEPTTALDVTLQAQIVGLLRDLTERGMAVVLVSHDIGVIAEICDRVLVMYAGRIVEEGTTAEVLGDPRHPYTRGLVDALPDIDDDRGGPLSAIPGAPFQLGDQLFGCPFAPRCPRATDRCAERRPALEAGPEGRRIACWEAERAPATHNLEAS